MLKPLTFAGFIAVLHGCATRATTWQGEVTWPDERSARTLVAPMEAGAALAAAGAIREVVRTNPFPNLFAGCASPEQGLDVSIFAGLTAGLYFVSVDQRFDRCGGPSGRVLDWWEVYAVTAQGVVVEKAPVPAAEDPSPSPPPPRAPAPGTEPSPPTPTPPSTSHPSVTPEAPETPVPLSPEPSHPEGP